MAQNLTEIFNRFVGREVSVDKYGSPDVKKDQNLIEMEKVAQDNGVTLRYSFPGAFLTGDYRPNRVNVYLQRQPNGKLRIGSLDLG
jgi:hypothetical protein